MKTRSLTFGNLTYVLFFGFFLSLGVINIWLKNPIMGAIYLGISLLYLPGSDTILKQLMHISIPAGIKFAIGLLALWSSIVVGNLLTVLRYWF
jgi:hypothetical protein